jgi:hypothetical protein
MHTEYGYNTKLALLAVGSLLFSLSTFAMADSDAVRTVYLSAAKVPTNIATIHTYPEPPKGFSPLTASDVELAIYGFPQRPDKQAEPDHYALWERAMQAAKIRWHGDLKMRFNSRRPLSLVGSSTTPATVQTAAGPTKTSNYEASGVILNSGTRKWSNGSFADLWTSITVPVVQLPFSNGSCAANGWYYSLNLASIDGQVVFSPATGHALFDPGESVGVLEGIDCFGGSGFYEAEIGWGYALNGLFSLNPGDVFYTEIHAFGGCHNGSAFVEDLTTLTFGSFTIPNPCSPPQTGTYANWVVVRPPWANSGTPDDLSPLANTIGISFEGAEVLNLAGKPFYPGWQAISTQVLTMSDDNNTQTIESVNQGSSGYQGLHSLFFQTTGCAFAGGCTP